jgi:beta-N-acetylhexosaminidase
LLSATPDEEAQVSDGLPGNLAEPSAERTPRFSVPHRKHVIPSRHAQATGYPTKVTRTFVGAEVEARPVEQTEAVGQVDVPAASAEPAQHDDAVGLASTESEVAPLENALSREEQWENGAPGSSPEFAAEPVQSGQLAMVAGVEQALPLTEQPSVCEEPWENGALAALAPHLHAEPQHEDVLVPQEVVQIIDAERERQAEVAQRETWKLPTSAAQRQMALPDLPTTPLQKVHPPAVPSTRQSFPLTRGRAFFLGLLLVMVIVNATAAGFNQFFGPQGWGAAFSSSSGSSSSLLSQVSKELKLPSPTPGATAQPTPTVPLQDQVVNALMANMTLDQKIGQMLMVRFDGITSYSATLDDMISNYHVGSVIEYSSNIASKSQLIALNKQIQAHGDLPMIIAIDQEGGTVDRLAELDGPEVSASQIGATGDPQKAYAQGVKDGQTLASYGINLNLAPVVDVTNVYNSQLAGRTYGNNPTIVTEMAGAYLAGLQSSGQVLGTIKHFPGLGDTSTDPHTGLPYLGRSLSQLNAIDWVPYEKLIAQGNVYAVMVTHEIVQALDTTLPSSLSPKVVGILRNQLHFNGVIITDGLNMDAILERYSIGQAAVLAIQAGDDLIMDPDSPYQVAQMVNSIKQALNAGTITQAQIDQSVRRVLLLKYQMGLLRVNS